MLPNPARAGDDDCTVHGFGGPALKQSDCLLYATNLGLLVYAVNPSVAQYVPIGCLRLDPNEATDKLYFNFPHDGQVDHDQYQGNLHLVCVCDAPASTSSGGLTGIIIGVSVGGGVLCLLAASVVAWWLCLRGRDYTPLPSDA